MNIYIRNRETWGKQEEKKRISRCQTFLVPLMYLNSYITIINGQLYRVMMKLCVFLRSGKDDLKTKIL